jgi:hypothetical protein
MVGGGVHRSLVANERPITALDGGQRSVELHHRGVPAGAADRAFSSESTVSVEAGRARDEYWSGWGATLEAWRARAAAPPPPSMARRLPPRAARRRGGHGTSWRGAAPPCTR